ncbi:MAG TPA: DNA primase [Cyanobacteria bacterium UBA9971]|nr:DNA primase [Cyanobacteria bacterium UBA9971]
MRRKKGSNKNSMVQKSNINTPVIDAVSEIKNRLDIVDVISEHIALKKSGRNYWGCCPFHKEKTPSFSVSPDKGIFKCFGCGVGGDAISFLMKINNNTFYEVIVEQAQKFGIPIQTQNFSPEKTEIKNQILEVNQEAVRFFNKLLLDVPEAAKARDYLFKRNITEEVIEKFKIGYSLNSYDSLISHFCNCHPERSEGSVQTGINAYTPNGTDSSAMPQNDKLDLLYKAGLVSERTNGKGYLDRFRGRIMIPIQDEKGDFIAFGARALEDNQNPKYLNSPDTPVFNKSRSLFALYQAKQSIKEQDSVIIMEGFFDVISAHTHGLTNVVATLGTALTEQHIKILARYSDSRRIYLAFDSDEAGINATDRGAEIIKSVFSGLGDIKQFDENFAEMSDKNNRAVCEIRVISNITGKDPDEFIRTEGLDAYKKVVNQAPLLIDYQINRIMKSKEKTQTPQEKSKVIQDLIPILSDIKNSIIRNEYIKLISEKLMIDEESLNIEIKKSLQKVIKKEKILNQGKRQNLEENHISAQKNLLSLYFLNSEKLSPLCINNYLEEVNFTEENISLIKNEISKSLKEITDPEKLSNELFTKLAENEEAKKILVDVICLVDEKKGMNTSSLEQYIKDHIAFLRRCVLSEQQNKLKTQYYASNKDDISSLEQQQLVKELILQSKSEV